MRRRTTPSATATTGTETTSGSQYFSPRDLALRWRCSRSTVDRIVRRAGLSRLYLGEGRHGIVRYLRREIEALEASRLLAGDE